MSVPIVRMYAVEAVDRRGRLNRLDLGLPAGMVGAMLGEPVDGTATLVNLLGGTLRMRDGTFTVDGKEPYDCPEVRRRMAIVPEDPAFPRVGTVRDLFALRAKLGDCAWSEAGSAQQLEEGLGFLGVSALMGRRVESLDFRQRRAVSLGLALTVVKPLVVVLFEPLCDIATMTASWMRERVALWAADGACVLIVTASLADASLLASHVVTLRRGRVGWSAGAGDPASFDAVLPSGARLPMQLLVWCDRPRELASRLWQEESVKLVSYQGGSDEPVCVSGHPMQACARAITSIAAAQGIEVRAVRPVIPSLQQIHEASSGVFAAAYQSPVDGAGRGKGGVG